MPNPNCSRVLLGCRQADLEEMLNAYKDDKSVLDRMTLLEAVEEMNSNGAFLVTRAGNIIVGWHSCVLRCFSYQRVEEV